MKTALILGGAGVFGGRIARELAGRPGLRIRLAGRNPRTGAEAAAAIGAEFAVADRRDAAALRRAMTGCTLVIHAAGPYDAQDYSVASVAIEAGAHYLDLCDEREFVTGVTVLDEAARRRGVFVASGASSAPALTDALIACAAGEFRSIGTIRIALSPGMRSPRGPATLATVLGMLGRPVRVWSGGRWETRPGWGDAYGFEFPPPVGRRGVHTCDVPDLAIFPERWKARTVLFHAGLELPIVNAFLSVLAKITRPPMWKVLPRYAGVFALLSQIWKPFGSGKAGYGVEIEGIGAGGGPHLRRLALITEGDAPAIPTAPAVLLAGKILSESPPPAGAFPCVGFLHLDEFMAHFRSREIRFARGTAHGWTREE